MDKTIYQVVADKILGAGENVKSTVIEKMADIEINRRIELVTSAVNYLQSLEKDLNKISRADIITYDASMNKIENTSKARFDDVEKLKQTIGELEKVTLTALEDNTEESYKKLSEKVSKFNGGNKTENKSTSVA